LSDTADELDLDDWDDDQVDGGRSAAVLAYLARALVDEPEQVKVEAREVRGGIRLNLRVAPQDMGKVIGRRGRVAQCIRAVVKAAGARDGLDVTVDIAD